ncbi:diguanylate cyclase [Paucibacter sp. APW11]|uniref:diguanylate cyclase n=1 Tax=Roseateles aquae TaxID=3077235 RepID=A0ABU3PAX6_9BURK|nr:diguanylate cyclase [Paucibacter sp. APW11]MDT8999375.1 diguanylate cyclase [Paucibacter sp. APW11]
MTMDRKSADLLAPGLFQAVQQAWGRKPKLLIVDDQPVNIQALYQIFASDCQVFMATSGEQALQLCQERQPDLVLLDVQMPGMDGYEVCRRIQADARLREIPVIFVTAHTDAQQETHGLGLGAVDFIAKPFTPAVVRARVRTHLTLKCQSDALRELAFLDGLTGVHNRRFFDERFQAEFQRARRNGRSLALMMVDVDYFKRFNDEYGHLAGDDCLRRVAECLRNLLRRPPDLMCRFGGEEFACVLPETELDGAVQVADRMIATVQTLAIPHKHAAQGGVVSVSIGLAACFPALGGSPEKLLAKADEQLYAAKAAGRARVSATAC